jgi:putative transposase
LPVQGVLQGVKQAFYGLCIQAGREVLTQMLEADRVALCGVKNLPNPYRRAVPSGSINSRVVLGSQRIVIKRPWVRIDVGEIELPGFAWAAAANPLNVATMATIAAGVSTRRYAGTLDELPPPEVSLCTSERAVSRRFVALS